MKEFSEISNDFSIGYGIAEIKWAVIRQLTEYKSKFLGSQANETCKKRIADIIDDKVQHDNDIAYLLGYTYSSNDPSQYEYVSKDNSIVVITCLLCTSVDELSGIYQKQINKDYLTYISERYLEQFLVPKLRTDLLHFCIYINKSIGNVGVAYTYMSIDPQLAVFAPELLSEEAKRMMGNAR